MFGSKSTYLDLAYDLRDKRDWKPAVIRELDYLSDPSVIAVEGTNGLIAVGTKHGEILLFGSLPTTQVMRVPGNREVKHLQFAALVFKLVCIDDSGTLHVWDLTQLGNAKHLASESFGGSVCSLTTSSNHSHAFISTDRGVLTYDILCQTKSPYFIPKVWRNYESNRLKLQGPTSLDGLEAYPVDVVIHPRDLNLVFIAFSTGIALFDLTDREVKRRYELMIPPGCPGAMGYTDPDLMTPRHPSVTSIALHASGQLFAVGYIDGTVAFWAVDEEERPLQVRTIDRLDVNFPDGEQLEEALATRSQTSAPIPRPEPVFKLSWTTFGSQVPSDPYNCDHILVVLGGLYPSQGSGLTALRFPPLILPSPAANNSRILDSGARNALSKALTSATKFSFPSTDASVISDFQLVPKDSSLFNGTWNPGAILTLIEGHGVRSIEAWEFPPPSFGIRTEQPTSAQSEEVKADALDVELVSTLRELTLEQPPQNLTRFLPTQLWTGFHAVREGDIIEMATDTYELLMQQTATGDLAHDGLGRAGIAWVSYGDQDQARGLASTKRQYHRLLITHHRDLTIRFQDISPQLLIGSMSDPLKTQYPAPLRHLTIPLKQLLDDEQVRSVMQSTSSLDVDVQSASLTSESSECCVVLRKGHVFIFRFSPQARKPMGRADVYDGLLNLQPLFGSQNSFQPLMMVTDAYGPVEKCELAEIGFLAIAYTSGTLLIIDLRGPYIVYKDTGNPTKRMSLAVHLHASQEDRRVLSMRWVVCGDGDDSVTRLKLIAAHKSGDVRILTLSQSSNQQWRVNAKLSKVEGPGSPLARGIFVMRAGKGGSRAASQLAFRQAVYGESEVVPAKKSRDWDLDAHSFLIVCGEKGARCFINLTGSRVGRVDWGHDHRIETVQVVEKNGAYALVALMENREALVYSIPTLEAIQSFSLTKRPASLNVICIGETGDFIDWAYNEKSDSFTGATLGTLFSMHRVFDEPIIDFAAKRKSSPSLPPPVPLSPISYLGSWFNFKKGATGDAIDALLAGPERPIPQEAETSTIVNSEWQKQMQSRAQTLAAQASAASSNLYTNLSQAMSERGELLQGVQESASQLEESGRQWMLQAKKMAAAQTGKSWLGL